MTDLLDPISDAAPAGDDLTFSPEFDAIAEARRHDDPSLAQGEWTRELKTADWPAALRLCEELLSKRTKDLRVAGWYAEAATHLRGFEGLADGYMLVTDLCRDFWDGIHPAGDDEERAGCLQWLVSQSTQWIRTVSLGNGFALQDLSTGPGSRTEDVMGKLAKWRSSVSHEHRKVLVDDVTLALVALAALENQVHARLFDDAPSFAAAKAALNDAFELLKAEGPTREPLPAEAMLASEPDPSHTTQHVAPAALLRSSNLQNRADALQALRDVARFFRDTEPHSPVAYLADKAARWGDMPLHAWLHTVLGEGEAFGKLSALLDIDKPPAKP
jgi:type VI secretion system protein ImpA